jgi:hypothetical protein
MKMAGWEDNFNERIASIRKAEVGQIERVNRYRALNEAIFYFCNVLTSVVIFLIHIASGGLLTPRTVFTTMVLINIAQLELTKHLSLGVMGVSECYVSVGRIQRFLQSEELENEIGVIDDELSHCAMRVTDVTCHWNSTRAESVSTIGETDDAASDVITTGLVVALEKINLEFKMGELTCIIGEVSLLLSRLLPDFDPISVCNSSSLFGQVGSGKVNAPCTYLIRSRICLTSLATVTFLRVLSFKCLPESCRHRLERSKGNKETRSHMLLKIRG